MRTRHLPPIENIPDAELASAKSAIVEAFGEDWLESNDVAPHPIKRLWVREDALVGIELISLGKAIEHSKTIDQKWFSKRIQDIKRDGKTSHGYVFEIMSISMMTMGGMNVTPARDSTPGIDAIIHYDDGFEIFASMKNHNMSDQERFFRQRCHIARAKSEAHLRTIGIAATITLDIKEVLTKPEWEEVEKAIESYGAISLTDNVVSVAQGKATICIYPLDAHKGFEKFSPHHFSDSFLAISAQYKNEQVNFRSNVLKGAKNLAKHRSFSDESANAILLKIHATADIDELKDYGIELLKNDTSLRSVSAIILYQTQVVRHKGMPVVSHHTQVALRDDAALHGHAIHISPMFGITSDGRPKNLLTSATHPPFDLNERYVFQAGDHYYLAKETPNGIKAKAAYFGPGLHAHAVIVDGDTIVLLKGKFPKDEQLTVI